MGSLLGAVVAGLLIGQVVGLTTLFVPKAARSEDKYRGEAFANGLELVVPTVLLTLLGLWADSAWGTAPLFLIIGMINTKDPVGYFKSFTGLAEKVYCVPIRGSDSMIDPVVLAGAAYDAALVAEPMSSVGQALDAIKELAVPNLPAPRILIGGSLYLVGDVLADNGTPPK